LCWQSGYWRKGITELEALKREESPDKGEAFRMSDILEMLDPIETIPEAEDL
jgi:hypothetical protein